MKLSQMLCNPYILLKVRTLLLDMNFWQTYSTFYVAGIGGKFDSKVLNEVTGRPSELYWQYC